MGVIASSVVACSGNIGASEEGDETLPEIGTSKEALLRPVDPAKELLITDPSVIESPTETTFDAARPSGTHKNGAWTIGRALHNMLPKHQRNSAAAASKLAFDWMHQWEADQMPNSVVTVSHARGRIREEIINPWKSASGCMGDDSSCVLDMGKAPFRLIAIVNRPDLRRLKTDSDRGIGGEGRFVFQAVTPSGQATKFTAIFEYTLPISNNVEVLLWAYRWHTLGALPFGKLYNAFLRTITNDFSGPDQDKYRPNGNAINQVRTNDVRTVFVPGAVPAVTNLGKLWEMREFHLQTGGLVQVTTHNEPSRDFDVAQRGGIVPGSPLLGTGTRNAELAAWINANSAEVLTGTHVFPKAMEANSAYFAGSAANGTSVPAWTVTGVPNLVRNSFALNTCSGCHRNETGRNVSVDPITGVKTVGTRTPFLMLTDASAFDPTDTSDTPFIPTSGPANQIVVADFLAAEIAEGGPRNADFVALLNTSVWSLVQPKHRRVCAD